MRQTDRQRADRQTPGPPLPGSQVCTSVDSHSAICHRPNVSSSGGSPGLPERSSQWASGTQPAPQNPRDVGGAEAGGSSLSCRAESLSQINKNKSKILEARDGPQWWNAWLAHSIYTFKLYPNAGQEDFGRLLSSLVRAHTRHLVGIQ